LGVSDIASEAIKVVVAEVQTAGARVVESEFISINGKVQGYVLVEYPIGPARKALLNQINANEVVRQEGAKSEAFQKLAAEVERIKSN
jgi:hypothetical protein